TSSAKVWLPGKQFPYDIVFGKDVLPRPKPIAILPMLVWSPQDIAIVSCAVNIVNWPNDYPTHSILAMPTCKACLRLVAIPDTTKRWSTREIAPGNYGARKLNRVYTKKCTRTMEGWVQWWMERHSCSSDQWWMRKMAPLRSSDQCLMENDIAAGENEIR
ncbi:hypothetical protein TNCV_2817691, partial [Trichonephila clavipes]